MQKKKSIEQDRLLILVIKDIVTMFRRGRLLTLVVFMLMIYSHKNKCQPDRGRSKRPREHWSGFV